MAQSALSAADVLYVYEHGRRLHCAGAVHCVLRRVDIPPEEARTQARLSGTLVTLDRAGSLVITVYRNLHALKHLRLKPKWAGY
jgi:hypothetical protein